MQGLINRIKQIWIFKFYLYAQSSEQRHVSGKMKKTALQGIKKNHKEGERKDIKHGSSRVWSPQKAFK